MSKSKKTYQSLENVAGGDLSKIEKELNKSGLFFRCNFNQISKHFLNHFLPIETFQVTFDELKNEYLKNIDHENLKRKVDKDEEDFMTSFRLERLQKIDDVIQDESKFHKYICKTYLDIVKEPKEELLSAFVRARQDIKEIDDTLEKIDKLLNEITKNNSAEEIQQKKPILYYYQEHNQIAKEAILEFLKNDIDNYALSNSYDNSLLSGIMGRIPYNYHWNPKSYQPKYPNDLENKFGELPLPEFRRVAKMYKEDKPSFHIYLSDYIQTNQIIFLANQLLSEHHLLDVRKEIISEALNIYDKGSKIMFANAVPTIIEGILHDLCILCGEDENELLQKGFQHKLDKLKGIFSYELYYEYYSFRFRLFRNKVAHGRLTKNDVDELSDLLLLDLYQICRLVNSSKLQLNQKRFVINELNNSNPKIDYKQVLEYLLLDKIEIPEFYKLTNEINTVEKIISSNEFWDFLEKEMDVSGTNKHGIFTILKIISNRKPFDKRCTKLFKKAKIENVDKALADSYIKYLTKTY
jgi:hypothetical protein